MPMSLDFLFRAIRHALDSSGYFEIYLKVKQIQILEALLLNKNVVGVLPTGYGKSVIFHILPFLFDFLKRTDNSIVLVVGPLDSLIEDQVNGLEARGVKTGVLKTKRIMPYDCQENDEVESGDELQSVFRSKVIEDCNFNKIKNGNLKILFSHPEGFISSKEGRNILLSNTYQERVVSCVIDEAHLVTEWGSKFREDFSKLSQLGSLFPYASILALTATAPPKRIGDLVQTLLLEDPLICVGNLDRPNILIKKDKRKPTSTGNESYEQLFFIAEELKKKLRSYPLTIVYLPLKWCGYAFKYFYSVLGEKSYAGERVPKNCLFAQFHASQTDAMKTEILKQICSDVSNIRVVFATVAIGLGVNIPALRQVIHIGVPRTLEAYYQEIGRAGRDGKPAVASLFYNKSDIAANVKGMTDEVRAYCFEETDCLRQHLLSYLGSHISYSGDAHLCCSNCAKRCCCNTCVLSESFQSIQPPTEREKIRILTAANKDEISQKLQNFRLNLASQRRRSSSIDVSTGFTLSLIEEIVHNSEYISSVQQLFQEHHIWDPSHAEFIIDVLSQY